MCGRLSARFHVGVAARARRLRSGDIDGGAGRTTHASLCRTARRARPQNCNHPRRVRVWREQRRVRRWCILQRVRVAVAQPRVGRGDLSREGARAVRYASLRCCSALPAGRIVADRPGLILRGRRDEGLADTGQRGLDRRCGDVLRPAVRSAALRSRVGAMRRCSSSSRCRVALFLTSVRKIVHGSDAPRARQARAEPAPAVQRVAGSHDADPATKEDGVNLREECHRRCRCH